MKWCYKCGEEKEEKEFYKNKSRSDGLSSECKVCHSAKAKIWRDNNGEKLREYRRDAKGKRNRKKQELVLSYLERNPCVVCGEDDILVLEFDHLRDKDENISYLLIYSSEKRLRAEMEKCQVVCRNCHGKKTHKDQNTYRWKYYLEKSKWENPPVNCEDLASDSEG